MHCTGVVLALLFWQVVAADYVDVEDEQVEPEPEPLVEAAAADGTVDSESSGLQLGDTLEGGENMHDASQPFSSAKAAVLHPLTADDRSRLESFFSTDVGAEAEHADHDDDNVLSVQTAAAYSIAAAVLNMEPVTKGLCGAALRVAETATSKETRAADEPSLSDLHLALTVAVRSNGGCKGHGLENIKGFKFETSHNGGFLVEAGKRALLELSSPGTDTAAWYHAAAIANTLGVEVAVEPLLEKIYQVSSDDFSMQSAGHMLRAAAQVIGASGSPALPTTARDRLVEVVEDVVDQVVGPGAKPLLDDASRTMATVALGVCELSEALVITPPALTEGQLQAMLISILDSRFADDAVRLSHMLSASEAVGVHVSQQGPLVFLAAAGSLKVTAADHHLTIEATTALGTAILGLTVSVTSTSTSGETAASVDAATPEGWSAYIANLDELGLSRGSHALELTGAAPKTADGGEANVQYTIIPATINVVVAPSEVRVGKATVTIKQTDAVSFKTTAEYPMPIVSDARPNHLSLTEADTLSIRFAVGDENDDPIQAQQVFLILTNTDSEQELAVVATALDTGLYSFELVLADMAEESFRSVSGSYRMDVVVGDSLLKVPVEWNLGLAKLTFKLDAGETDSTVGWLGLSPDVEVPPAAELPPANSPTALSVLFSVLAAGPCFVLAVVTFRNKAG